MQFHRASDAMDLWLEWVPAAFKVGQGLPEVRRILKIGDRYLLIAKRCSEQAVHNDFKYEQDISPRYFLLVTD